MSRECVVCKKPVLKGMTDGDFYCHDGGCFEEYMDSQFGKYRWMALGGDVEDAFGGYYIVADDYNGQGYRGTGIYYTEWDDE